MKARLIVACACMIICAGLSGKIPDIKITDSMLRSDLVKLKVDQQRDVFLTLSPETKAELWKYKLSSDISSGYLTEDEKAELQNLFYKITPEVFDTGLASEEFNTYVESLVDKMCECYNWTEVKVFYCLVSIMTLDEAREYFNIHSDILAPEAQENFNKYFNCN